MNILKYLLPVKENLHIWITAFLMILGLMFFKWNPKVVVFSFLFESIIIGLIHVIKMIFVILFAQNNRKKSEKILNLFIIPFFFFHYFFFIAIQMVFVFLFINIEEQHLSKSPFELIKNFTYLFSLPDMKEAYSIIIMNNVYYTIKTFFIPQKYLNTSVNEMFMQPYFRVIVQQFVAILGGFLFFFSGGVMAIAMLLIVLKTFVDLIGISLPNNPELQNKIIEYLFKSKGRVLSEEEKKQKTIFEKMFE